MRQTIISVKIESYYYITLHWDLYPVGFAPLVHYNTALVTRAN